MKNREKSNSEWKGLPVLLHIMGWIILFILPQILIIGDSFLDTRSMMIIFYNTAVSAIIFYVNYLWLIPKLLGRRRGLWYFSTAIAFLILMQFISREGFRQFFPPTVEEKKNFNREQVEERKDHKNGPKFGRFAIYNFYITSILVSGFALGLRYGEASREREKEIKELEQAKLNSELSMLKNQVSPHFFFNTLNNIYSLIEINKEDAQASVLNLSKMMRYMLYDSEHGNTRLKSEIEFMKNYIDLMKLRLSNRVTLTVDFPEHFDDVDIPPLLFISFIENAFKHGVSYQGKSFINISLVAEGSVITFIVQNSVAKGHSGDAPGVESGIGLENVRKRLTLLFGDNYDLSIEEKESVYSVTLKLDTTKATNV
jgi:two-component system, LytTR family, sensor kinase